MAIEKIVKFAASTFGQAIRASETGVANVIKRTGKICR